MLILLSIICIIFIVIGIILIHKGYVSRTDYLLEGCGYTCVIIGAIALVICIIALIFNACTLATAHTIDEKIAMYEEENRIIEEKVELSVSTYLNHEQETLTALTPENAANFVFLYPELSSDSVIKQQITTYLNNHNKIVSLKLQKINLARKAWWVYFGS